MQAVNNASLNKNTDDYRPITSLESLYSGFFIPTLATPTDCLGTSKPFFDSEYSTFTSSELQNGQLKQKNFAQVMETPTKCRVCVLPTNCCHYGVPACNGCKVFFRRYLLGSKAYTCQLNEMCDIMNGVDQCRACRFDRCILAGMNPRLMRFPTSVDVAKISKKVSHRRRYLSQIYGEICPVLIGKTGPVFEETIEDKIIQSLVYVELKVQKIRESSHWLSDSVIFRSIRELLESNNDNVLAHADQCPKELKWPLTETSDFHKTQWTEMNKLQPYWLMSDMFLCIDMVSKQLLYSVDSNFAPAPVVLWIISKTQARTMPVFSQLDYNDQEALLKQIIPANVLLLQAFYSYQMKSETLIMPNGFIPNKPPTGYGIDGIIDMMERLSCRAMVPISRIQMTMEEFVLLKAIIYTHSAIHGLSKRGKVLLEKESIRYSKTLMKHSQSRMGAAPGAKKYAEIVSFVGCIFHGAQQLREIHIYMTDVLRLPLCCPPYMKTIMYA